MDFADNVIFLNKILTTEKKQEKEKKSEWKKINIRYLYYG